MSEGLLLLAHGSRTAGWAEPFARIAAHVARLRPDARVRTAFLEHGEPALPAAIDALVADGAQCIVIAPLFLGVGRHVREDLPHAVAQARERHAQVRFSVLPSLGESDALAAAIAAWVVEAAQGAMR